MTDAEKGKLTPEDEAAMAGEGREPEPEAKPKSVRPIDGLRARVDGVEAIAQRAMSASVGAALLALMVLAVLLVVIAKVRAG